MTKKTTVSKSSSKKEAQKVKPLAKPKTAKASAKKTVSRTSAESSAKTSKAKKGKKTTPKNSKTASKSRVESAEGEKRVRELASKNITLKDEEKVESRGFSLNDVRQILKTKTDKKDKQPKIAKKKLAPTGTPEKAKTVQQKKSAKVKKLQTASVDDILGFGVSLGPTRPFRDESKVPSEWRSFYNDLMSLRASLKGALGERSSETIGASARESSGELSLNSSDAGTETFDRDVALSMVASEQEALEEVEDAIDRIFDGTYGICQETKKPIKKTRLKVVPFTRFSLEGQTQYEQRSTREQDSGSGAFATIADSTMGVEE
jgi:RNA polymerase-binding transcription factor DksA